MVLLMRTYEEYDSFALALCLLRCGNAKSTALSPWCCFNNAKSSALWLPTRPKVPPIVLVMWKCKEYSTFALAWFEKCKEYNTLAAHAA